MDKQKSILLGKNSAFVSNERRKAQWQAVTTVVHAVSNTESRPTQLAFLFLNIYNKLPVICDHCAGNYYLFLSNHWCKLSRSSPATTSPPPPPHGPLKPLHLVGMCVGMKDIVSTYMYFLLFSNRSCCHSCGGADEKIIIPLFSHAIPHYHPVPPRRYKQDWGQW